MVRPRCVQNRRAKRLNPGSGRGWRWWWAVGRRLRWMDRWRSASREHKGHGLAPNSALPCRWWEAPGGIWPFPTGGVHPGTQTRHFCPPAPGCVPPPLLMPPLVPHYQRGAKNPPSTRGFSLGTEGWVAYPSSPESGTCGCFQDPSLSLGTMGTVKVTSMRHQPRSVGDRGVLWLSRLPAPF